MISCITFLTLTATMNAFNIVKLYKYESSSSKLQSRDKVDTFYVDFDTAI